MNIKIGSIIREMRAKQGVTQEQLAAFIGVTPQAISRWEGENGYPDIETLPQIADFFSITVDELLGLHRAEKEARRQEIHRKIKENVELGVQEGALDEARLFAAEFAGDEKIQEYLADTICRVHMWEDTPDLSRLSEAERIYRTLIDTTKDHAFRNNLLESLAYLYAVAFKDRQKLEQTLNELPLMVHSRESVGADAFWALDKRLAPKQDYIEKLTDGLGRALTGYIIDCMDNSREMWDLKIALLKKVIGLYQFVFGEDMLFYHTRVADLYRIIATYKVAQGKYDDALSCLEAMLAHIQKKHAAKVGERYESPFMSELALYENLTGLGEFHDLTVHNEAWYVLTGKLTQPRYDPIRDTPRFQKILEELDEIAQ